MKKFNPEHSHFVVEKNTSNILYSAHKIGTVVKWVANSESKKELEILTREQYTFRTKSTLKKIGIKIFKYAFLKKSDNYERVSNFKLISLFFLFLITLFSKSAYNVSQKEYTCLEKGTITEITSVRYRTVYFKINNKYKFSLSQPNIEVGQETCIVSKEVYKDEIKFHYGSEEIKADLQQKYE